METARGVSNFPGQIPQQGYDDMRRIGMKSSMIKCVRPIQANDEGDVPSERSNVHTPRMSKSSTKLSHKVP